MSTSRTQLEQQTTNSIFNSQSTNFKSSTIDPPSPAPHVPIPPMNIHHVPKTLTSSTSFDSKSNIPNFSAYQMSAEAARLFQTLQQSPLPTQDVNIKAK